MITIKISDQEALVLYDFLSREIDSHKGRRLATAMECPAEFWALNVVHCSLQSSLAEPLAANYAELVAAAREKVVAQNDPEGTYGLIGGADG